MRSVTYDLLIDIVLRIGRDKQRQLVDGSSDDAPVKSLIECFIGFLVYRM